MKGQTMKGPILLVAAAVTLVAAPPTLQNLEPHGGERGKSFTLYLRGDALPANARIETTLPASFSRLTVSKDPAHPMPAGTLAYLVTLKPDAPIGLYPIRVATESGISNVLLFSVGDLPEIEEAPAVPDAKPQQITAPVVVNGRLRGPAIDSYSFHAASGQKLVFEVEARRMGSAIDPALEIYDAAGHEIARNDDAAGLGVDSRIEVTFPKAGEYRVAVHDSKFSEQAQNFYRLKIAKFEYADSLFPLGGPKGTEVTLSGGNLARPVRVKAEGPLVNVPGSHSLPIAFALADGPETIAAGTGPAEIEAGRIVNGRIARPGEIDRYRLPVKPGESWVFEIAAASLGTSRLDAILTAYDAQGKKLASADDGNGLDPLLPFTVPDGVHEITLAVEDLLGRGGDGYGYRLAARRGRPDFVASLLTPFVNVPAGGTARVAVLIQRRGYAGEIRVRIPNLPAGFQLAGGHVPPEAAAQDFKNETPGHKSAVSTLTITAPAGVKTQSAELRVVAEADTGDGRITREAVGPGLITAVRGDKQKPFTAPWLGMKLPMAITDPPPATIAPETLLARFAQGFAFDMQYEIRRTAAVKGPLSPRPQILSAVGNLRVLKGTQAKSGDKGSYTLETNFATPFSTFDVAFTAQAEVDGHTVEITSPILEVQVVPGYEVTLTRKEIDIQPGGEVTLAGRVRREPTFEGGLIKVQAEDLPDHVSCQPVEVLEDKREFMLSCSADASAKPGAFPIRISSVAPNTGRKAKSDYKIPDIEAKLQVGKMRVAAK
jgi:hypothetical protein